MAAAPHLFDEPFVASPELALVDGDLAAQLREDIRSGAEFHPRAPVRPEFRLLHPVTDTADVSADTAVAPEPEFAVDDGVHDSADVLLEVDPIVVALEPPPASTEVADAPEHPKDVVPADDPLVEDVATDGEMVDVEAAAIALDVPADGDEISELPNDVVLADDLLVEDVVVTADVLETEPVADALDGEPVAPAIDETPELPDYVVLTDDVFVADLAVEAEVAEAPEQVAPRDGAVEVEPVAVESLPAQPGVDESLEPLDDAVSTEETVAEVGGTAFLGLALEEAPASEASSLPDYVVLPEDSLEADAPVGADQSTSDYPELPDLGLASEALEETDAALRRIREQFTTKEACPSKRRLRRRFTIVTGLGAMAAVAALAVNVQLGVIALGF